MDGTDQGRPNIGSQTTRLLSILTINGAPRTRCAQTTIRLTRLLLRVSAAYIRGLRAFYVLLTQ